MRGLKIWGAELLYLCRQVSTPMLGFVSHDCTGRSRGRLAQAGTPFSSTALICGGGASGGAVATGGSVAKARANAMMVNMSNTASAAESVRTLPFRPCTKGLR